MTKTHGTSLSELKDFDASRVRDQMSFCSTVPFFKKLPILEGTGG